ncbi:MAG: PTS sugar transporter subunit IIA [Ethanoligenens sp.]|uniref:PTS sugar transporter subunit IIA n=1 Tax=Ethanoligenens sp. TaxID=2099655 RepID=UPI0039EC573F
MASINEIEVTDIQLNIEAADRQSAVRKAAQPLVDTGNITTGYVDEMLDAMEKLGPYFVIAPGLALAHARPSENVKQTGFSIATFQTPIKFGSAENDPVDIVIVLASIDSSNHLEMLQKIVGFLNEEKNIAMLREAASMEDAVNIALIINKKGN